MTTKTDRTFTERQVARLREKCASGPDSCAALITGILGDETPPLTERQAEQTAAAAALHFATTTCARCALELAEMPSWVLEMSERVEKAIPADRRGLAVALARTKISCDARRQREALDLSGDARRQRDLATSE